MNITSWTPERANSSAAQEEMMLCFDQRRDARVLVVPALFEEANKLRRFTVSVMRALDEAGIDSALPDLPGCNESTAPLVEQTLAGWRTDLAHFSARFKASHVLSIRAGALIGPESLPGWQYAPVTGERPLANMLRARVIASREAGIEESREELGAQGREHGLMLAGWDVGAEMFRELENARPIAPHQQAIEPSDLGSAGPWLRAEPGEDAEQSEALARVIAQSLKSAGDDAQ
jgi:hypothetical protein